MIDQIHCAVRELVRKPLRSFFTMLGYVFGSGFVFALALFLHQETAARQDILNYMGTHFVAFAPAQYKNDNFVASGPWPIDIANETFFAEPMVVTTLLPVSLADSIAQIPEVRAVTPFLLFRFKAMEHIYSVGGFNSADEVALAGTATTKEDVVSGVFLSPDDRGAVIVDEKYALMWELSVGSVVKVADRLFPVIGIVRPGARPVRADIYMNWPDAEAMINKRVSPQLNNQANLFLVQSAGIQSHDQAMKKVEKLMPSGLINTTNCSVPAIEVMGLSENSLWAVMIVAFIVVLLFAANSSWVSVLERQRDLAIVKALGWKNSVVLQQIFIEALLLALVGCILGLVAGYLAADTIARIADIAIGLTAISSEVMALAGLILLLFALASIVASLFPALRAIKLSPAELLRNS